MKISQIVLLTVMVIGCAQASRRALKHENPQVKKHQVHHTEHRLKKLMKKKDDCGDYETEFTDIKGQLATLKTEMEAQKTAQASSKTEIEAQKTAQASQQLEIDALKKSMVEKEAETLVKPKEETPFEKVVVQDKTINLLQQATVFNQYSEDDTVLGREEAKQDPSLCLQSSKDPNNRQVFFKHNKPWQAGIAHTFNLLTSNNKLKGIIDIGSIVSLGAFSVFQYSSYLTNIIFYKAKDETATRPPGPQMENWVQIIDTPIVMNQISIGNNENKQTELHTVKANVVSVTPFKARYLMVVAANSNNRWTIISGIKGFSS